jgi:putative transposase
MPRMSASAIKLSAKQEAILSEYIKSRTVGENLKSRSEIIILANQGKSNNAIEKEMGISGKKVTRWRNRYSSNAEEISRIEVESPHKLRRKIEEILGDEQRAGVTPKFGDEQVAAIIALACEDPAKMGLPFSHWSPRLLRLEAIKHGIVEEISVRQVGRFLKRAGFTAPQKPELAES